jgi:transposase-like protein
MKKERPEGATPRGYDAAFQEEAVRMWEASGQSAEQIAQQLGLSVFLLYKWKRQLRGPRAVRGPRLGAGAALPEDKDELKAEVTRLRMEVARLTEQREILKKAAGILSEQPPRGTPGSKH